MTKFQRCAISIIARVYCTVFKEPNSEIRGGYAKVYARSGKLLYNIKIRHLSYTDVEFDLDENPYYNFDSESKDPNSIVIKSDDIPDKRIRITERKNNRIQGQDGYYNYFTAEVQGNGDVLIDDRENTKHSPYTYRMELSI